MDQEWEYMDDYFQGRMAVTIGIDAEIFVQWVFF